jgi:hypothetical protein
MNSLLKNGKVSDEIIDMLSMISRRQNFFIIQLKKHSQLHIHSLNGMRHLKSVPDLQLVN